MNPKPPPRPPIPVGPPVCVAHRIPGDCRLCRRADFLTALGLGAMLGLVILVAVFFLVAAFVKAHQGGAL